MDHFVELGVAVPEPLECDFLSKLPYVSTALETFALDGARRDRVRFRLRRGREDDAGRVAEGIREVARRMCAGYRPIEPRVLVDRTQRPVPFRDDPHPRLEAAGELRRYGNGRYGLGPLLSTLVDLFDREWQDLAREFGAEPRRFPALIGADALDRCRYIQSFPHSLSFVSHLDENLEGIREFGRSARWTGEHLECDREALGPVRCLLAPSVCFHYYAWLQDSVRSQPACITAAGRCFRYESANMIGLERLWDFTMREIVFVGPADYVLAGRERAVEACARRLDRWGLAYEIRSATDPFFIEDYPTQTAFQAAFELKFEVCARLPYRERSLAVGSFNYHQDFFGRSFNITGPEGAPVHTACAGWGLERLALAFLAQYGPDPAGWPAEVARAVDAAGDGEGVRG